MGLLAPPPVRAGDFAVPDAAHPDHQFVPAGRAGVLWIFRIGLVGVVGAVVYHSFNGLRIIAMDMTGFGVAYQRQMWYGVLVISVLATGYAALRLYPRLVGGY